jgi:endonuclease III
MQSGGLSLTQILDALEARYGQLQPLWPTDPYSFLVWWQCGYPPSEAACAKGWASLRSRVGVEPEQLLGVAAAHLAEALRPGGLIHETRAERLQEIAARVQNEFAGDLSRALQGSLKKAEKTLRTFPGIAGPGADRILLFGDLAAVAAVPSSSPYVLVRICQGTPSEKYDANYRAAQGMIEREIPEQFEARRRAYLLLHRHGQELCKRTNPRCEACPVSDSCVHFSLLRQQLQ